MLQPLWAWPAGRSGRMPVRPAVQEVRLQVQGRWAVAAPVVAAVAASPTGLWPAAAAAAACHCPRLAAAIPAAGGAGQGVDLLAWRQGAVAARCPKPGSPGSQSL